jgi:hypothetical protein
MSRASKESRVAWAPLMARITTMACQLSRVEARTSVRPRFQIHVAQPLVASPVSLSTVWEPSKSTAALSEPAVLEVALITLALV